MAVALARLSTGLDDDMTQLCPTVVEAIVDHYPATDACAKRQHHEVARSTAGSEPPFGQRGCIAVVLDPYGEPEAGADPGTEIDIVEREIGCTHPPTCPAVEVHGCS